MTYALQAAEEHGITGTLFSNYENFRFGFEEIMGYIIGISYRYERHNQRFQRSAE